MKTVKILNTVISILFLTMFLILFLIISYLFYYDYKYKSLEINKFNIQSVRNMWGNPSYTSDGEIEIIDTHMTPINKYVFIYNKKDSILIKKWREY